MPAHCELVHIGHVGRHGSRHGTRLREAVHIKDALLQAAAGGSGGGEQRRPSAAPQRPHGPSLSTVLGDEALRWVEEHIRKVRRGSPLLVHLLGICDVAAVVGGCGVQELPVLGDLTVSGVKEQFSAST